MTTYISIYEYAKRHPNVKNQTLYARKKADKLPLNDEGKIDANFVFVQMPSGRKTDKERAEIAKRKKKAKK